jgi:hypothetical protein
MDKVKLYAQERLDLDDTRALQSLTEDYLQESFGALLGFGGGALSVPVVTTEENSGSPYITFAPFTFATTTPNTDRGAAVSGGTQYTQSRARIVNYDPAEENAPEIDITVLRAGWDVIVATFGSQYVWARPILVDTDTGTRRKWDVTSGTETTFSAETRTSQRVEFVIQNAEPAYDEGESRWAKVARITGWTDGTNAGSEPQFQWYSVFDDEATFSFLDAVDTASPTPPAHELLRLTRMFNGNNLFTFDGSASDRSYGIITLLAAVRRQLALINGYGVNDPAGTIPRYWDYAPFVSLSGAHNRLTTLESRMTGGVQCIASAQVIVNVDTAALNSFVASYTGPSYGVDRSHSIIHVTGQQQNRANIALKSDLLAEGWAVTHVDVTQIELKYALDPTEPDHYDYNRVSFVVDPSAYTEDTTDGATMTLDNGPGKRGVVVEFLPWIMDDGLHAHDEDNFHAPDAVATDSTKVLDRWAGVTAHLRFSVAVYAVASDNADT